MSQRDKYPYFVVGLDIGGTKIAGAILRYIDANTQPEIVFADKVPSMAVEGGDKLVNNICNFSQKLCESAKQIDSSCKILTIGAGCAGRIDKNTGKIMSATDSFPGFLGCDLANIVSNCTGYPVYILNDVQSHTLGEARWGAGKNVENFVLLAIGTGIGGAIVCDSKLLMGSHGYAGELGHIQVNLAKGITCACGKTGHLEAVSAGRGIEKTYKRKTKKSIDGSQISKLAQLGDEDAVYAIELAGRCLGQSIAIYLSIFDPEIIVLSGSVKKAGKIWRDAVMDGFNEEALDELKGNLNLVDAKLGDTAAIIGACEYALDRMD